MSPTASPQQLLVEALTTAAFAPFGDVIAASSVTQTFLINEGTAQRFHALGQVDCAAENGYPLISMVRAQPRPLPFPIRMLERHPLGSQAFIPLSKSPYLIVVAISPNHRPRAFLAKDGEGVNFHRGTWHHPLLALDAISDFLVIDRGGEGDNCEEAQLDLTYLLNA
ncbi:MAG: ureidoglycolate lyase [Pseudomarimonas sp.]